MFSINKGALNNTSNKTKLYFYECVITNINKNMTEHEVLDQRFNEAFLSIYKRPDLENEDTTFIPLSKVIKLVNEYQEPFTSYEYKDILLMLVIYDFKHKRQDGEFYFLVEKKQDLKYDPNPDFY